MADIRLHDHGSMIAFEPVTDTAKTWVDDNLHLESWQWMGSRFALDGRFAPGVVQGMQNDGLVVEG